MSDWKKRAKPVGDWKARAKPVDLTAEELELANSAAAQAAAVKPQRVPDTSMLAKAKAALMGATYNAAPRIVELNSPDLFKKSQAQADEDLRARQRDFRQASRDNPWSDVGGAVFSPDPFSKLSLPGRVLAGGGLNALSAYLGEEPGDVQAQREAGEIGFTTGVGGTLLGEGLVRGGGKVLSKASSALKDFGRKRAIATLSPSKADVGIMQNFPGRVQEIADDLYGSKMIGPLSNTEDVAKRLAPEVERRGAHKGAVLAAVDSPDAVNPTDLADRIRYDATQDLQPYAAKDAAFERALDEADKIAGKYDKLSLTDSERFVKSGYDDAAQKAIRTEARGGVLPGETEALDVVRRAVKKQNEDIFAQRAVGTPLEGEFVKSKQAFGRMAEALNIADKTGGPKAANRFLSPTDYAMGISAGHAREVESAMSKPVESTLTGLATALAHNQLRTRGAALMTHAGYKGSALSKWLSDTLASEGSRSAASAGLRRYSLENPEPGDQRLSAKGAEELRRYLLENSPKAGSDEAGQHYINGG